MLWIYTHDNRCYTDLAYLSKKFTEKTNNSIAGKNVVFMPDKNDVIKRAIHIDINTVFVAPYLPQKLGFENEGFFSVVDFFDFLTAEAGNYGIKNDEILKNRLGLKISSSKVSFKNMAGADKLIEDTENFLKMEKIGEAIGGIFLFGVPGTGKSFFAECFAGETGRKLVDLDLSSVMYSGNPSKTLNDIIELLLKTGEKYVLWIDEIEKMFNPDNPRSIQVLGRMLTILNDISKNNVKEIVFIATANSIEIIEKNNPEFLRKGRFRKLYFLNFPTYRNAVAIFNLYLKKYADFYKKHIDSDVYNFLINTDVSFIVNTLEIHLQNLKTITDCDKFIYTPAEISVFVKEFCLNKILNPGINNEELIKLSAKEIIPMQFSAKKAIQSMISQKEKFGTNTDISKFVEVS